MSKSRSVVFKHTTKHQGKKTNQLKSFNKHHTHHKQGILYNNYCISPFFSSFSYTLFYKDIHNIYIRSGYGVIGFLPSVIIIFFRKQHANSALCSDVFQCVSMVTRGSRLLHVHGALGTCGGGWWFFGSRGFFRANL